MAGDRGPVERAARSGNAAVGGAIERFGDGQWGTARYRPGAAYLGYLNREVLRPVTLSVHVYSVRVEREADYDLGLSFSIARLLGEALRVSVGANAVALIKPSPGGESGDTCRRR